MVYRSVYRLAIYIYENWNTRDIRYTRSLLLIRACNIRFFILVNYIERYFTRLTRIVNCIIFQ